MIKIEVQSTRAVIRFQEPLTVGLRGAKVSFAFGQDWENLSKTAVFRQVDRTVSVAAESETVIPWEVLTMPGVPVQIGVYGVDSTGAVAIPTVWAVTQPVRPGTDPEGDPALEPTPGLWEQMQGKLADMETALQNTATPVYVVTVRKNEDGSYWADRSSNDRANAYRSGRMLMCHWLEYDLLLPLSYPNGGREFAFRTVKDGYEYCVEMTEDIQCTRKALEAEAPVQSVNGQTGDVVLPTPLKVTVSQGTEGDYFADTDPDFIQEALDHNRTLVCCWQEKNVMLPLTSFRQGGPYNFTAVTGKQEYSVTIYDTENIACTVTKLSPEAVLYTPQELTPEQQAQALKNLGLDELPTGGSSNVFSITEETTEAVTSFTIQLPTTFDNIYILNVHITFGTIEQTFKLHFHYGNGDWKSHDITAEMEAGSGDAVGLNLFSVRYGDKARFALNGISNSYYYAALPSLSGNMSGRTKAGGTKNNLWFGTNSDSLFIPAGTKFNVWGLRK